MILLPLPAKGWDYRPVPHARPDVTTTGTGFLLRSKAHRYLYYRSWQKALSWEGNRTCWLLGQRTGAVVRDLQETREEGPSDFGGGVNRGRRPRGVPVGASRWRCRTTDVVRGRSFLPHFAPVRGGSWGGAWEPTAQTLEGSKKNTHATVEKSSRHGKRKDQRKNGRKCRDWD